MNVPSLQLEEKLAELGNSLGPSLAGKLAATDESSLCIMDDACNLEYLRLLGWYIREISAYISVQVCFAYFGVTMTGTNVCDLYHFDCSDA
jgi:hypothetical protein